MSAPEPAVSQTRDGGLVRVRLDMAYDGGAFAGWARQPGQRTVQGELEAALRTVLRIDARPVLTVAGRTDAGVHARGQVCHLDLRERDWIAAGSGGRTETEQCSDGRTSEVAPEGQLAAKGLVRRLAGVLPSDVRVRRVVRAPAEFDARFGAVARRYAYRLVDDLAAVDPLHRSHVVVHPRPLDVGAMNAAAARLLGEHDFTAYCRRRVGATAVRTLLRLVGTRHEDGLLVFDVEADAFCHQMVRSLVGALVVVGEGRRDTDWPGALLSAPVRAPAVPVMPAHGLTLEEVRYPPDEQLAARAALTRAVRPPLMTR